MAFPTSVNNQITDAVTQSSGEVLGLSSAVAMANLYQATAEALALAAHNAVLAQQQNNIIAQSVTAMGVAMLYSLDTSSTGMGTKKIFGA